MLHILVALLLAGASQWALFAVADTGEGKEVKTHIVVLSGDDGEQVGAAAACCPTAHSVVLVGEEADCSDACGDGKVVKRIVKHIKSADAGDKDRGWLGVSIGEVPDAVSSQLNLADRGTMVLSVLSASPADRAGMEAHDIIVAVGGVELDGTIAHGLRLIGEHKPGDEVPIAILREGKEKTITVTLGSRADMPAFDWKMELPQSADIEEKVRTHGRILRRSPEGEWVFENLGDLTALEDLPENILQFIPKAGSRSIHISDEDAKRTVKCVVHQDDGSTIEIEQVDDEEIVVNRTDEDGNESRKTYADADALREGDPEAFEFFNDAGHEVVLKLNVDGLSDLPDIDIDLGDLQGRLDEWQTNLSEGLENYEQYLEQFRDSIEQWKEGQGSHNFPIPFTAAPFTGKPARTFEIRVDGTIEARIRTGDSELVRIYENEADLERRNPELFKKYQDLIAAEE